VIGEQWKRVAVRSVQFSVFREEGEIEVCGFWFIIQEVVARNVAGWKPETSDFGSMLSAPSAANDRGVNMPGYFGII
jgi:hypothetical protein